MNPRIEVSESVSQEFLEKMRHPKVEIIRKLEEAPAQISLLNLMLVFKEHRKVLGKAYLPKTVYMDRFKQIVGHILANNTISFVIDNIPKEWTGHCKPLRITTISSGYLLGGVLLDGGSALNVCPYDTFKRMNIDKNSSRDSQIVVRAFDGSRRETFGEIKLPVEIGPYTFNVSF